MVWHLKDHISSVQFSLSVMSDSLQPHELQHARPPCPSPTPRVHSNSRPSSQWCHPAISSSVVPFSSCPQSLPASGSFPMSQLFTWGGQNTGVSVLASLLPKNTQDWSPSEWTGWISLQSKGLSRVFSNTTVQKHQFFGIQLSSQSNSHNTNCWYLPSLFFFFLHLEKCFCLIKIVLGKVYETYTSPKLSFFPHWNPTFNQTRRKISLVPFLIFFSKSVSFISKSQQVLWASLLGILILLLWCPVAFLTLHDNDFAPICL